MAPTKSWLELDRFDVYAKVPPSTSVDTARLMLQGLLADRFKLMLHKDSRPLPGFALTARKGGTPKLKPADGVSTGCKSTPLYTDAELTARRQAAIQDGANPNVMQTFSFTCENMTMAAFAEAMRNMPGALQRLRLYHSGLQHFPRNNSAHEISCLNPS